MEKNNLIENNELSNLKESLNKAKEWFNYLLLQWKIIVLLVIIGGIMGLTYSLVKKPTYNATLTFATEDETTGALGGALGLAGAIGLDLGSGGGGIFTGDNIIELFKSRSMVEKTLLTSVNDVNGDSITLAELYIKNNEYHEEWESEPKLKKIKFLPGFQRDNFTRVHDSILGVIFDDLSKESLSVEQMDKDLSIVTIGFKDKNERFAKLFCETLVKTVSDFYVTTKSKKAKINLDILTRQTDSIRRELNNAITGVAVATDNVFMLNQALNVYRTPSSRKRVDVEANLAIFTELIKQTELAKVTLRKETPLVQVIDQPILPLPDDRVKIPIALIIGGFLGGFLTVTFLIGKKIIKDMII